MSECVNGNYIVCSALLLCIFHFYSFFVSFKFPVIVLLLLSFICVNHLLMFERLLHMSLFFACLGVLHFVSLKIYTYVVDKIHADTESYYDKIELV